MQCGIIFTASALIDDRAINIGSIVEKQGKLSVKIHVWVCRSPGELPIRAKPSLR